MPRSVTSTSATFSPRNDLTGNLHKAATVPTDSLMVPPAARSPVATLPGPIVRLWPRLVTPGPTRRPAVGSQAVEQLRVDNGSERTARALRDSCPLQRRVLTRVSARLGTHSAGGNGIQG